MSAARASDVAEAGRPVALAVTAPLFFASGAAALVLESLWIRLFALSFGTTGLAMSTVLTAYMAGLALGAGLGGRAADRLARPGRLLAAYGAMEGAVAIFAAAMPALRPLAASADTLFEGWLGGSLLGLSIGRFLLASLLLLPPTTLMGATLPLLARAVAGAGTGGEARVAERAGFLYAMNTFGAVVGAALTPFVVLPALGVSGASWAVAGLDLAVASVALALARRRGTGRAPAPDRTAPAEGRPPPVLVAALVGIALSGGVAMVYQQVWARVLSLVIGSSIYAVSIILALFLAGLALGSAVYSRRTASQPGQAGNLAVVHLMVALWSVATLRLADLLPAAFVLGLPDGAVSPARVLALQVLLASAVVLPPTFFMGMTFPATLRLVELARPRDGAGRAVGGAYAANTLGSIAGSFAGGFVALPALGAQAALVACTALSAALALGYAALSGATAGLRRALAPAGAALAVVALLATTFRPWNLAAMSAGVFRVSRSAELAAALRAEDGVGQPPVEPDPLPLRPWIELARASVTVEDLWNDGLGPEAPPRMLFHEAGLTATVAVTSTRGWSALSDHDWLTYSLRVNGKADASLTTLTGVAPGEPGSVSPEGDAETQVLSGLLPYLLHPGEPRSALIIGWGSGVTAGAALATGLESVTAVEIERQVLRGSAPFQPYAGAPLENPRLEVVEDDGRRLLAARPDEYDIIVSEPSNPWITGCSNLFTVELFRLAASRLRPGGRFLQWVQAYEISPATLRSILAALSETFATVRVFRPAHSPSDLLIVAGDDHRVPPWSRVAARLASEEVGRRARVFGVLGPEDVAARLEVDGDEVRRLADGAVANSDDNLLVELAAPWDLVTYRDVSAGRTLAALGVRAPDRGALLPSPPADAASRLEAATARLGRLPPPRAVAPSLVAVAGPGAGDPLRRLLSRPGRPPSAEAVAAALGTPEEPALCVAPREAEGDAACAPAESAARSLALLGLSASAASEDRLAALLLTAHLRLAADPVPEAREALARLAREAGLPYRAWQIREAL